MENKAHEAMANAMIARGHQPIYDRFGELCVLFAVDDHAYYGCARCGWRACFHCIGVHAIPKKCRRKNLHVRLALLCVILFLAVTVLLYSI
jgi:hypothetical protein